MGKLIRSPLQFRRDLSPNCSRTTTVIITPFVQHSTASQRARYPPPLAQFEFYP